MKLNKTPKVMAGSSHHLSVRSVRSLILARVGEKTPDIASPLVQRFLKGKCALDW